MSCKFLSDQQIVDFNSSKVGIGQGYKSLCHTNQQFAINNRKFPPNSQIHFYRTKIPNTVFWQRWAGVVGRLSDHLADCREDLPQLLPHQRHSQVGFMYFSKCISQMYFSKCIYQNVFLKCISQNVFLKCIYQNVLLKCISQNVFLKMYFSKCISQNVFLTSVTLK